MKFCNRMLYGGQKQKTAIFFLFRSFNTILELSLISRSCLVSRCLSGACQFVGMYMVGGKSRHNKKTQKKGNDKKKNIYKGKPMPGGGGVTQQMFIRGGSGLRSNPLPFYIPFFIKKVLLSYTFYSQMVPLSPCLHPF